MKFVIFIYIMSCEKYLMVKYYEKWVGGAFLYHVEIYWVKFLQYKNKLGLFRDLLSKF